MRESIGATWIFSICLTFIILFTCYLAISVNYAKAFKIKSHIVSSIEENEGYNTSLDDKVNAYLLSEGYTASGRCPSSIPVESNLVKAQDTEWNQVSCINGTPGGTCSACIYRLPISSKADNDDIEAPKAYYKVLVFFKFDVPVLNHFMTFKVTGDTRYVFDNAHGY